MASVAALIQEAAPRNKELLGVLRETDHARPDLDQQKRYIADLDAQLKDIEKRVRELSRKRMKELQDHEKYRDSVMRRFAYKVGRKTEKFDAKAAKEEREYFDALQEEHGAKEQQKGLTSLRQEALRAQSDLEQKVARHVQAQQDLDGLYNSIFQGPTPDFPEEDNRERLYTVNLQKYQESRGKFERQSQAVQSLRDASDRLANAGRFIEEALDHSRMDMFGGGSITDMMERNALHNAEMQVNDAFWHVSHARREDPTIHELPPLKIAKGNIMSDMLFDNIFTDMAFHDKIKDSSQELKMCVKVLAAQIQGAMGRCQELDWDQKQKSEELDKARIDLQKARESIFERTGGGAEAPPSYEATQTPK
ncbi:hypothetical protein JX265_004648 [Neoarthrinium moseri]|uniref:Uncharacterized protein n=1 Tax=Neoarthrinium moseri TaxID=1658444 RepID=A0A9P9WPK4_9PEZI|nr:hypothetical protein JX265_004648 [Neoarthrinium moseri]